MNLPYQLHRVVNEISYKEQHLRHKIVVEFV